MIINHGCSKTLSKVRIYQKPGSWNGTSCLEFAVSSWNFHGSFFISGRQCLGLLGRTWSAFVRFLETQASAVRNRPLETVRMCLAPASVHIRPLADGLEENLMSAVLQVGRPRPDPCLSLWKSFKSEAKTKIFRAYLQAFEPSGIKNLDFCLAVDEFRTNFFNPTYDSLAE